MDHPAVILGVVYVPVHVSICCYCLFIEQDWCEGPMKRLLEDKVKRDNLQAIKDCFQNMFQHLLDSSHKAESGSQSRGNEFGPFRKRFAQVNEK